MKTLNSVHSRGMAAKIGGMGVLAIAAILLLSFAPFFSFAAGTTVTVQTSAASYSAIAGGGQHIPINGTVSPAPGASGYSITLEVTNTAGLNYVVSTAVNATTGHFAYTLVTGTTAGLWVNGTYTVTGVYTLSINTPSTTGSTTFKYGSTPTVTTTTSQTGSSGNSGTTTTIITTIFSTTIINSATTVLQGGSTTTVLQGGSTTTVISGTTTTVSGSSTTALAIGAVGLVIAIIAGALAAMALRKK